MNTIVIFKTECRLEFALYQNNTVAILAHNLEGELFCVPTVNWEKNFQGQNYRKLFQFPFVAIKDYGENEGVLADLVKANVIIDGCYLSGTYGKVHLCSLTELWQDIAQHEIFAFKRKRRAAKLNRIINSLFSFIKTSKQ